MMIGKGAEKKAISTNLKIHRYEHGPEVLTFPGMSSFENVQHLISTRIGGVSEGIFATMNVSFTRGDDPEHVMDNYRRIAICLNATPEDIVCTDQTHTTNIRIVTGEDRGKGVTRPRDYSDIDGLLTNERGIVLAGFFADCVPVLFYDQVHQVIGVAHSGWRGTVHRIGAKMVEEMCDHFGSDPEQIHAAIGPSICRKCYEVSEDVISEVRASFSDEVCRQVYAPNGKPGKYQLDLWELNRQVLLGAGLLQEHIEVTDLCTACHPDYLFSHRASHGKRGNLGAFIKLR